MCFRKQGSGRPLTQQEKLVITLYEEMQTEKPANGQRKILFKVRLGRKVT
jgi:hypothetical protein